jgi:hypothetical protein
MRKNHLFMLAAISLLFIYCKKSTNDDSASTNEIEEAPAVYKKIYGASSVYVEGDYVVIKSTGVPDHKSPYFATSSSMYVNDTRAGFNRAPNSTIQSFSYTFKIPLHPKEATTKRTLGAATIGVAINGVPFFNQYQMQGVLITPTSGEYTSFDLYAGHPTPFNEYHYHIQPSFLVAAKGSSALLGFLLDGFPVYGPTENGKTVANSDLDVYHGHISATADYPEGIYHYHTTSEAPYINGNGYYGVAGTWSK